MKQLQLSHGCLPFLAVVGYSHRPAISALATHRRIGRRTINMTDRLAL
jgi:hypothetical protein